MIFYLTIYCKTVQSTARIEVLFVWQDEKKKPNRRKLKCCSKPINTETSTNKRKRRSNQDRGDLSSAMDSHDTYEFKLFTASRFDMYVFVWNEKKSSINKRNACEKDRLKLTYRRRTSIRKNKTHKSENYCFQFIKLHSILFLFPVHAHFHSVAAICVMATSSYSKRYAISQFDWFGICFFLLKVKLIKCTASWPFVAITLCLIRLR